MSAATRPVTHARGGVEAAVVEAVGAAVMEEEVGVEVVVEQVGWRAHLLLGAKHQSEH